MLALHLVSVITWFAGIFYLPRLFVYHAMSSDREGIERFKVMEQKLYRQIMTPSAIATAFFGLWLVVANWQAYVGQAWFWIKLALVLLLYEYHRVCGKMVRSFATDSNRRSDRFYRWFNEAPLVILLGVTILAVVKPF